MILATELPEGRAQAPRSDSGSAPPSPSERAGRPGPADQTPLEWSVNPWHERPGLSALALGSALGLCVALASLRQDWILTVALSLAAIASLSPALSPAVCRVDGSGLGRRGPFGWSRRAWGEVRRVAFGRSSVLVSPFSRPHWLDPYRALVLPLPGVNRSRLEADLRTLLATHGL